MEIRRIARTGMLAGALIALALPFPAACLAQTVLVSYGSNLQPSPMSRDTALSPGTLVEAGPGSFVVLETRWAIDGGAPGLQCVERIVVSDASHRIPDSSPTDCPLTGDGTSLARAVGGESMVGRLVFIQVGRADYFGDTNEEAAARFDRDLADLADAPPPDVALTPDVSRARGVRIRGQAGSTACFHKQRRGWENGNNVHLWACNAGDAEMRTWIYDRETGYIRAASNRNMCLHKQRPGWENGNNIHLWACNAGDAEMKTWIYEADTGYIRAASNRRMCLHKQRPGWENGNNIHLWACNAGNAEMKAWRLTSAGGN